MWSWLLEKVSGLLGGGKGGTTAIGNKNKALTITGDTDKVIQADAVHYHEAAPTPQLPPFEPTPEEIDLLTATDAAHDKTLLVVTNSAFPVPVAHVGGRTFADIKQPDSAFRYADALDRLKVYVLIVDRGGYGTVYHLTAKGREQARLFKGKCPISVNLRFFDAASEAFRRVAC